MAVDFHTHILPGIDDGAADLSMSSKMLDAQVGCGVNKIVATPHFYLSEQKLDDFLSHREEAYNEILPYSEKLKTKIVLGAEVLYTPSLAELDLKKLCIGDTRYIVLELPYKALSRSFIRSFHNFINGLYPDIIPVLAHAERYLNFTDEDSIYEILNSDILVQINCGSFKMFSPHLKFIYRLIGEGMVHFLGSDCHNLTSRAPNMDIAKKAITRKFGAGCFDEITNNAERVLSGRTI